VGTALLSALITQREQFHDFRIGERVTSYSLLVQSFLNTKAAQFEQQGGDPVLAMKRAYKVLSNYHLLSWPSTNASSWLEAFSWLDRWSFCFVEKRNQPATPRPVIDPEAFDRVRKTLDPVSPAVVTDRPRSRYQSPLKRILDVKRILSLRLYTKG